MNKDMTLAEIINEIERRAKELDAAGTFHGENKGLACILAAGLLMGAESKKA